MTQRTAGHMIYSGKKNTPTKVLEGLRCSKCGSWKHHSADLCEDCYKEDLEKARPFMDDRDW
jgi:uncharacterized OB-fold protein